MKEMLLAHHEALEETGLAGSITDTARSLILEALSAHRKGVLVSAVARRAHLRVTGWVFRRTKEFVTELSREIEHQIALMESSPCPCCGRPMSEHDDNHR